MTGFSFEIRNDDDILVRRLTGLHMRLGNLTTLMKWIAAYLRESTRERFKTNLGPDDVPWKPSLRVRLYGGRTLVDHGILRDSIVSDHGADFAAVGTNDPRALIHQLGGVIVPVRAKALAFNLPGVGFRMVKRVVMPARPFVGLSSADREKIDGLVDKYVREAQA